ncbi:MAG: SLBB domain-containing protein [Bacteroides sp.]|uniref:SLBB domain-containing protein n=2 Tax=Bacteroides sp. TaxID=29523 RepID=UPI001B7B7781|nr:SLBB domain-containing protein [Bacteroides sp.]MBP6068230.1 SLBB domain-containing protein [Bacteroides sp.]
MHRFITLFLLVFMFSGAVMAQNMSDDQVIQYVKEAQKQGKTEKQITTELMRQGVTKEQVERIKKKHEDSDATKVKGKDQEAVSRQRGDKKVDEEKYKLSSSNTLESDFDRRRGDTDQREVNVDQSQEIFGHNIFTNQNLTFEPNINIATPTNYRLGPGDEVIIDVWGASETTIRQTISPEGSIHVSSIGPVYLSGLTIKDATSYLQREFMKIYAGISGSTPSSQVKLSLGQIRTIQVNIMGEVAVPGTYALSSFSSVFHALYRAGGVNKIGSLRTIKVVRSGKTIADLDVYDFIMKGKMTDDVRLQDGDVILVEPYDRLVKISGKVKRPMFYEMKKTESIATLLKYSGGFTGDAYKKAIRLIRKTGREHQVYNVDEMDYSVFRLEDGDELRVDSVLQRFENRVEVRGAVYRPGMYQINGDVNTVKQLIKRAEGIRGDAFMNRVILDRENADLSHTIISVDLKGLLNGTTADIPLQKNDILYIPSVVDLKEEASLTIHGEVARPGTYAYAENMTIEDLVIQAGGLLESASMIKVDVARRLKNPKDQSISNTIGENFSLELKDGFLVGDAKLRLEPFDEVYIRRSPAYHKQLNVQVSGEVLFGGSFALSKKNERLSDLIAKAGGVTPDAYIKGARLIRKMTEEEYRRKQDALRLATKNAKDSISVDKLDLDDTYSVGIDLQKALNKPKSSYDMVLREGDQLFVPEYISTVKINGAVMYPNTVLYKEGENMRYYINQAGGYEYRAKKSRAYVVYMNGTVSRLKTRNSQMIEPGCEIIIPSKSEKRKMSTGELIGIGTSTASLATMIATMVSLFK